MTLTRVVGKGRTARMEHAELTALCDSAAHTVVDAGTGDGRYAYAVASAHPEWLVVGLDALDEPMGEMAHKALRKAARGGRANVVYVRAAIEALPAELFGIADEVHVLLPWGRLLEGIVLAQPDVAEGLASLGRSGARVDITLNGEIWAESTPTRYQDLPVATPGYVAEVVAPGFGRAGITLAPARYLSADEATALPTTWARRLGHGRAHPRFVHFEGYKEA
jgi:16S rRNA (adenine(1408)-N(1))-methyltransferase